MRRRAGQPIGLQLTRTARAVSRAFDEALARSGGSLPVWLVLMSLEDTTHDQQGDLAAAVGIEGPTLTHHLNRMEREGTVVRSRDPENRRVHRVDLTAAGHALFRRLLGTVIEFDRRLRAGIDEDEVAILSGLLERFRNNVSIGDGAQVGPARTARAASITRQIPAATEKKKGKRP